MIVHGRVFCDCCGQLMGNLWNEPACTPDALPAPDYRLCPECYVSLDPRLFAEQIDGGRGQ